MYKTKYLYPKTWATLPLFLIFITLTSYATSNQKGLCYQESDDVIKNLYQHLPKDSNQASRIDYFSKAFLDKPYKAGPTGEGKKAIYNQNPIYQINAFDCLTYVETIIALVISQNESDFLPNLIKIRYKNGQVSLTHRNHFTGLDWLENNEKAGIVKDITATITDKSGEPVYLIAKATIDKKSWYRKLGKSLFVNPSQKASTEKLFQETDKFAKAISRVPYIPLTQLFDSKGKANHHLFKQIPDGAIISIVRPNWQLKDKIGTNLNISHLGFNIIKNEQNFFRNASIIYQKVTDSLLEDYLKGYLDSPTIKGINVTIIQ